MAAFPGVGEEADKTTRAAKSSVDYWKTRVRPRTLKDGKQTPELYLRIKEAGRDAWICLDTANRATAASKARDLAERTGEGLEAFLPSVVPMRARSDVCTVGEYILAARKLSTVRGRTLASYEAALRRVFAGVLKITADPSRYAANSQLTRRGVPRLT